MQAAFPGFLRIPRRGDTYVSRETYLVWYTQKANAAVLHGHSAHLRLLR